MRRILACLLLLVPLGAIAAENCRFSEPRHLQADLAGVAAVRIQVNSFDLHVHGRADTKGLQLDGKACASSQRLLDELVVSQHREGDRLVIELGGDAHGSFTIFGRSYRDLDVTVAMPADLPLDVQVGSGDAQVTGVARLDTHVGSGDLHVDHVAGPVSASVGSGDIGISDIGSLQVSSVGSGDLVASNVRGDVKVGNVGSGDVSLRQVGGNVDVSTLGSGDLSVEDVGGDLRLGAKGSGDVDYRRVKGAVQVPRDDD